MISTATKTAANVTKALAENDVRHTLKDTVHDLQDRSGDFVNNVADYAGEAGARVRGFVDRTVDGPETGNQISAVHRRNIRGIQGGERIDVIPVKKMAILMLHAFECRHRGGAALGKF